MADKVRRHSVGIILTSPVSTNAILNSMEEFYSIITSCKNLLFEKFPCIFKVTHSHTPAFGHHLALRIILSIPLDSPLLPFLP